MREALRQRKATAADIARFAEEAGVWECDAPLSGGDDRQCVAVSPLPSSAAARPSGASSSTFPLASMERAASLWRGWCGYVLDPVDAMFVDFHNQRLHSVVAKPYDSESDRVHRAVAMGQGLCHCVVSIGAIARARLETRSAHGSRLPCVKEALPIFRATTVLVQ